MIVRTYEVIITMIIQGPREWTYSESKSFGILDIGHKTNVPTGIADIVAKQSLLEFGLKLISQKGVEHGIYEKIEGVWDIGLECQPDVSQLYL